MMEPLGILRLGTFCPVGLDSEQTATSIWAGVHGQRESRIQSRRHGPVVLGHLPSGVLPQLRPEVADPSLNALEQRLLRLATPALHEVLGAQLFRGEASSEASRPYPCAAVPTGLTAPPPLLVATPQPMPHESALVADGFIERLVAQAGVPVAAEHSRVFGTGHAAFFAALRHAQQQIFEPGLAELAVVGGVDSYVDDERIDRLEEDGRLKTGGAQDAFTPGEGAAFVLVAPRSVCGRRKLKPFAWIDAVGVAEEDGHRYSEQPHRGDGLAQAVASVFEPSAAYRPPPARVVMAGLTGEQLAAKEWGVAFLRNRRHFVEPMRVEHSAEYIGDAGAALAPVMLSVAVSALRDTTMEGPALVWGSSDRGQRGALLLQTA